MTDAPRPSDALPALLAFVRNLVEHGTTERCWYCEAEMESTMDFTGDTECSNRQCITHLPPQRGGKYQQDTFAAGVRYDLKAVGLEWVLHD